MKEALSKKTSDYEYVDINESLENLKEFLLIRDTYEGFETVTEEKQIGIPCMIDGKKVYRGKNIKGFLNSL